MKSTPYSPLLLPAFIGLLGIYLPVALPGQTAPSPAPNSTPALESSTNANATLFPKGFMGISFGEKYEKARDFLSDINYQFEEQDGWQLKVSDFSIGGLEAQEGTLSFSKNGFYEGEAKVYTEDSDAALKAFISLYNIICSKYLALPKVSSRVQKREWKDGQWRNKWDQYWMNEWVFHSGVNVYRIKLAREVNTIRLTYTAKLFVAPTPLPPSPSDAGLQ